MKILVTGGAGFIGSNLCLRLVNEDYHVICVDDLSVGNLRNIEHIRHKENFSFFNCSILDTKSLLPLLDGVDVLVHLAAGKIPRYGKTIDTLRINGLGSFYLLEAASIRGVKVIAASTSDVYGMNPELPFSENSKSVLGSSLVPRWSYAISKLFEEHTLFALSENYGNSVAAIRFFGAYGPHQSLDWKGGPIPVFISKALKGEPLEIHGDGTQTRTLSYIDDHIEALSKLVATNWKDPKIYNFGSTCEVSILELASLIWGMVQGKKSIPELRFRPYSDFGRYEDVKRRIPNNELAFNDLGVRWDTTLDFGLEATISWQRNI